jgi:hypothetical protein
MVPFIYKGAAAGYNVLYRWQRKLHGAQAIAREGTHGRSLVGLGGAGGVPPPQGKGYNSLRLPGPKGGVPPLG